MGNMNPSCSKYIKQIGELQIKLQFLSKENEALKKENEALKKEINNMKKAFK